MSIRYKHSGIIKKIIFEYFKKQKDITMTKKILIVTTNSTGEGKIKDNGVYLEEFARPYLIFKNAGYTIDSASLKGGLSPIDINSMSCSNPIEWDDCIKVLRTTKSLLDVDMNFYDAIYFPGGHGCLFDIANNEEINNLVEYFYNKKKVIAAICHGVIALVGAKDENGESILKKRFVTAFTNKEEQIAKMDTIVPFSVEDKIKKTGAKFIEAKPFSEHAVADGNIITGQNQNSAGLCAKKLWNYLKINNKRRKLRLFNNFFYCAFGAFLGRIFANWVFKILKPSFIASPALILTF